MTQEGLGMTQEGYKEIMMSGPNATFDDDETKETAKIPIHTKVDQENSKAIHVKVIYFVYDTCPNSFGKNSHLRRHQESVHSKARKYTCLLCSNDCV